MWRERASVKLKMWLFAEVEDESARPRPPGWGVVAVLLGLAVVLAGTMRGSTLVSSRSEWRWRPLCCIWDWGLDFLPLEEPRLDSTMFSTRLRRRMMRKAATTTATRRMTTPAMMPPIAPPLRPLLEPPDGELAASLGTLVGMNLAATSVLSAGSPEGGVGVAMVTAVFVVVTVCVPDVVVIACMRVVVTGAVE